MRSLRRGALGCASTRGGIEAVGGSEGVPKAERRPCSPEILTRLRARRHAGDKLTSMTHATSVETPFGARGVLSLRRVRSPVASRVRATGDGNMSARNAPYRHCATSLRFNGADATRNASRCNSESVSTRSRRGCRLWRRYRGGKSARCRHRRARTLLSANPKRSATSRIVSSLTNVSPPATRSPRCFRVSTQGRA